MTRRGPNQGSGFERQDGRRACSVRMGWIDGKRVRKHVIAHTGKEAADKMAALFKARDEHRPVPDRRTKVGPFLRQWLDAAAQPTIRASSYESYDAIVTLHLVPGLGRTALAKLTPADVQSFLNRKAATALSPRRVQMLHAILRAALVTAERWGYVSRNVAKLASPPRVVRHEISPMTPEQAKQLFESSADDRYRPLWVTALATGPRQGELLALRWEDVDLKARRLTVRHTLANVGGTLTLLEPNTSRSRRTVSLPDTVVSALRGHRTRQLMDRMLTGSGWTETGHVFASTVGKPLHAATVSRAFKKAPVRAGLPDSRFHDLRHATATFLVANGMGLEDVKNQLAATARSR